MKAKRLFSILLLCLSIAADAQVESRYDYFPGLIFRETFESQAYTIAQNSVATNVVYTNGIGIFNGTSSRIQYHQQVGVKGVRVIIENLATVTQSIIKLSATHSITINAGVVTATGFVSPTIYVDGFAGTALTTAGGEIFITTDTPILANDFQVGYVTTYLSGALDRVELYNIALSEGEVYNRFKAVRQYTAVVTGNFAYGVQFSTASSSPDGTRIGNMALHASLPIQSAMRACLLNDNGLVNYYLSPSDWSKKILGGNSQLDGTDGQVMIEIPAHYYVTETVGTNLQIFISTVNLPGYKYVPKFYIGAYKMALSGRSGAASGWKGASVVNMSVDYRGGGNSAAWDSTYRTLLGKPATYINRSAFRTYAGRRGIGWTQAVQWQRDAIYRLYMVEYATRNSQKAVDVTLTAEGYYKGGCGNGVTTVSDSNWNTYNGYYPLIPCGQSNTLASGSGEVTYAIPSFPGATGTVKIPRYRGIESPFGDLWEFTDGINIYVDASFNGEIYTKTTAPFTDDTSIGYVRTGTLPNASGYISAMNTEVILPLSIVGGGATAYYCDYFYRSGSASAWRVLFVGGSASAGASAGFVCSYSPYSSSSAYTYIGSRLCYMGR